MTFEFQSAEEYLQVFADVAGWRRRIEALSQPDALQMREALEAAVQPHLVDGCVRVAATALCGSARAAATA
jgi:hypothetical protein